MGVSQNTAAAVEYCGPADTGRAVEPAGWLLGFWDNHGEYMPRIHCLQTADGSPDWAWIAVLGVLTLGIIAWYLRIFRSWLRWYYAEQPADRNRQMMRLAQIFLWCAVCGYGMSLVMFVWPAYRLLAVFLLVLNVWSWRFVMRIEDFGIALQANRLARELREHNGRLEHEVAERTAELEEARLAADEANQTKGRFLANMSHELRTPLASILGYAELIEESDGVTRENAQRAATIRRNGRHLLEVINDILDLSRVEAGMMPIESVPLDIERLVADVTDWLSGPAKKKGIELTVRWNTAKPGTILGDPTRLRQIALNLAGNALKFTEKGRIRIELWHYGDDRLRIEVEDTGCGIPPEKLEHLFNPFVQADSSTARRFGGTGLGLSISRRLAEAMGGGIDVQSEVGVGSTFVVSVRAPLTAESPLAETPAADAGGRERREPPAALRGLRVLVADDGEDNRRLIRHHLERAGAEVLVVENGFQAVEFAADAYAEGHPFDVVVLDMQMPVLDGYGAARQLKRFAEAPPLLALTARSMKGDADECLAAGCDAYLSKPFAGADLLRHVAALASGETAAAPREAA